MASNLGGSARDPAAQGPPPKGSDAARRVLSRSGVLSLVKGALLLSIPLADFLLERTGWTTVLMGVLGAGVLLSGGVQLRSQRYLAWWMRKYDKAGRRRAEKLR